MISPAEKLRVTSPNSSLIMSSQVSPREDTYVRTSSGVSGSTHGRMPERVSNLTKLRSVAVLLPLPLELLPLSLELLLASTTAIAVMPIKSELRPSHDAIISLTLSVLADRMCIQTLEQRSVADVRQSSEIREWVARLMSAARGFVCQERSRSHHPHHESACCGVVARAPKG